MNKTALHWSAERGYIVLCELLLKKKAKTTAQDIKNRKPIDLAI